MAEQFITEDGVLKKYLENEDVVTIPDGIREIGTKAFEKKDKLQMLIISEGVEAIGPYAFYQCSNLQAVKFPKSLKKIGLSAFAGCESLVSISLPEGLESIGESAFIGTGLRDVKVPSTVKRVPTSAFPRKPGTEGQEQKPVEVTDNHSAGNSPRPMAQGGKMKAMVCEMCGSNDLVKQGGLFVCQHCGTKYSVEEAKKLMIEGKVDVSGSTVKIDSSDELENLFQLARRAKNDNNNEEAAKYYDMILLNNPNSWEATFYSVYFKALMKLKKNVMHLHLHEYLESTYNATLSVQNCLNSTFVQILTLKNAEEQEKAVNEVSQSSINAYRSFVDGAAFSFKNPDSNEEFAGEIKRNKEAAAGILRNCGKLIEEAFEANPNIQKICVQLYKPAFDFYPIDSTCKKADPKISYALKISKYEKDFLEDYINSITKKDAENLMYALICGVFLIIFGGGLLISGIMDEGFLRIILAVILLLLGVFIVIVWAISPHTTEGINTAAQKMIKEVKDNVSDYAI